MKKCDEGTGGPYREKKGGSGDENEDEDEDEGPAGVPGMVTRKAFGSN